MYYENDDYVGEKKYQILMAMETLWDGVIAIFSKRVSIGELNYVEFLINSKLTHYPSGPECNGIGKQIISRADDVELGDCF